MISVAAMVRLVKRQRNSAILKRHADNPNIRSYRMACDDLLAALAAYKKGTP